MVLQECYKQVTGGQLTYPSLESYLLRMLENSAIRPELLQDFDIEALDKVIDPQCDLNFDYMGAQIITDRYLTRTEHGKLIEMPQHWLMRVAMGIALDEPTLADRTDVTAEDVIFTINKIQDPANKSPKRASFDGVSVEKISEKEGPMRHKLSGVISISSKGTGYVAIDGENKKNKGRLRGARESPNCSQGSC
jgi:ribonucleotide reductase alpha subunit